MTSENTRPIVAPNANTAHLTLALCACLALALVATPTTLHAQESGAKGPSLTQDEMKLALDDYFDSAGTGAITFMSVGGASIVIGGLRISDVFPGEFSKGVGITFIAGGVISTIVGLVSYVGLNDKRAEVDALLASDPASFKTMEAERMASVNTTLNILTTIDTIILVAGAGVGIFGALEDDNLILGLGMGAATHGATALGLDIWSHIRVGAYTDSLEGFNPGQASQTDTRPGWLLGTDAPDATMFTLGFTH